MLACVKKCANLWCFLVVFCLCYFLETITFTYLVSAVQSVERQFQISSKKAGTLIAASDIGYVLTVVVLAYLGSKGNRARWIGGGCVLISMACFLAALPSFIFPNQEPIYSHGFVVKTLVPKSDDPNLTVEWIMNDPFLKPKFIEFHQKDATPAKESELFIQEKFIPTIPPIILAEPKTQSAKRMTIQIHSTPSPIPIRSTPASVKPKTENVLKFEEGSGNGLTYEDLEEGDDDDNDGASMDDPNISRIKRDVVVQKSKTILPLTQFLKFAEASLSENDTKVLKAACNLPFSFCNATVSKLKNAMADEKCKEKRTNNMAYGIVFIAIACIGVGHSMPWTLGMPLIDDNVKKQNTPFFFAGVFFIRIMGPVLGFVLGGWSNKLYVSLNPPPGLTPSDPGWIGAWWLGFLVVSGLLFIPSVLLCCFPNIDLKKKKSRGSINRAPDEIDGKLSMPMISQNEKQYHNSNTLPVDEVGQANVEIREISLSGELKSFFVSLAKCLKSPVYSGALIGRLFDAFAFKGFFVFQPKFLQTHYGIPQYLVNYYMAVMGIVGFAGGVVVGSFIMRKFKLEGRRAATYVGVCSLISAVLAFSEIFLGCQSVVGQIAASGINNNFTFTESCNDNCACETSNLFPVCDKNHTAYFNPCFAGCTRPVLINREKFQFNLTQCGCVNDETVSRDFCQDDCKIPMRIYFALSTFSGIISGSSVIPGILIVFRSVPHELRSVALGFSGFIVSLLSTFPSPIVLGWIIDTTCILWDYTCGIQGSCQIYDPRALRIRIHVFHGILRACGLLFDVWVWYWAKHLKLMDEKDEEKKGSGHKKDSNRPLSMPELRPPQQKRSAIVQFVENFGSQYEINVSGVGDDAPSNLGGKMAI